MGTYNESNIRVAPLCDIINLFARNCENMEN